MDACDDPIIFHPRHRCMNCLCWFIIVPLSALLAVTGRTHAMYVERFLMKMSRRLPYTYVTQPPVIRLCRLLTLFLSLWYCSADTCNYSCLVFVSDYCRHIPIFVYNIFIIGYVFVIYLIVLLSIIMHLVDFPYWGMFE